MSPFLGEIRMFAFNFAPKGWAFCNGQILNINQNQALFALLGTTYGGNGVATFALPNLQGNVVVGPGGSANLVLGQTGGEISHVLTLAEMPAHTHVASAAAEAASSYRPAGALPANTAPTPIYSSTSSPVAMSAAMLSTTGGSQAHENRQPFLVLNRCIALSGIFPSRS